MKYIKKSDHWNFNTNPFVAIRCQVDLGAKKYHKIDLSIPLLGGIRPDEKGVFEKDSFILKRDKDGISVKIAPGEDRSNCCLLCVGSGIYGRGTIEVLKEGTTGTVLCKGSASVMRRAACEAMVLLRRGRRLRFILSRVW